MNHSEKVSEKAANQRQRGAHDSKDLVDSLAAELHCEPDQKADADRHESDLIAGQNGDKGPRPGAYQSRHGAGKEPTDHVLFGFELLKRDLDHRRIELWIVFVWSLDMFKHLFVHQPLPSPSMTQQTSVSVRDELQPFYLTNGSCL